MIKGVTHGACEYLLEPVGNMSSDAKHQSKFPSHKKPAMRPEKVEKQWQQLSKIRVPNSIGTSKDQKEVEVEEGDENGQEIQKKAWVVWSQELYRP